MLAPFFLQECHEEVERQRQLKHKKIQGILGIEPLRFLCPDLLKSRTRMDLMWQKGELGLRGPWKKDAEYEFFEIKNPDSVAPPIVEMMQELERDPLPVELAQLRFRYSSSGDQGIWIDTSNENIKNLLDEATWLRRFLDKSWIIEMGQKHKSVYDEGSQLKLKPAPLIPWLPSFDLNNIALALKSQISVFSQPGPEANRALIAASFDLLMEFNVGPGPWIEFGAGYGNLSAAFYSYLGPEAVVSEYDPNLEIPLQTNQSLFFPNAQLILKPADKVLIEGDSHLWLLDPPRPGFPELLRTLGDAQRQPQWIMEFYCHEKGLSGDSEILIQKGYKLQAWSFIYNFPGSEHAEVVALWKRI